ncbi:SDR family oxidoreductase [Arachidicoccus sp.]|uniref:SDR family oxidoreductase n=1 Tax=Arachidicoccus sp. TaxID=1872624 RepID=UPI003D2239BA
MKTVLITGANQGIGFETAKQLAQLGYFVYVGSRDKNKGLDAIKKLNDLGVTNVEFVELDVTSIASIQKAKELLDAKLGSLDVLINNAGISGGQPQNISAIKMENLRNVFDTNFLGAVQTTQQFIPLLTKSKEPRIVNVSSGLGSLAIHSNTQNSNFGIYDAYSCSKTALNAFTVMLANEFKNSNFKINSVTPGYTATNLNHYQGTQTVEQGAKVIVKYATLGTEAPTGGFFGDEGALDW